MSIILCFGSLTHFLLFYMILSLLQIVSNYNINLLLQGNLQYTNTHMHVHFQFICKTEISQNQVCSGSISEGHRTQTLAQTWDNFKTTISLRDRSFLSRLVLLSSEYLQGYRLHSLSKQLVLMPGYSSYEDCFRNI